ncbi:MAG: saccharopine dehydrogenase NADP-binding domain-containing protein [Bacteroidales bacterium]|nr:saccharopine dehydrogenase NADP-binding domain-containing protein [Bacteroidales bacterium]
MQTILILGAGLSSNSLIKYFLDHSEKQQWLIRVGDINPENAIERIAGHPNGEAILFDVHNVKQRREEIKSAHIVISLLPARMHHLVAESCVELGRNMVTASYLSPAIKALDQKARKKGIVLMNECGVDPGIDHMSAMQMICRIREEGGELKAFESSTGGLVAPGFENNPWQYKFTWNPRNVVLAGKEGARFLHNGKFKYIPYHKVFRRIETIRVPDLGEFEVYGNRDSLTYRETYGLHHLETMFRGTIRRPGYCEAWDIFVQLGATDDSYVMENTEEMTYREFINSFMAYRTDIPVEEKLSLYLGLEKESMMMERLLWLGIFDDRKIGVPGLTPAKILQKILEEKWKLNPGDKDMIVMQHQFDFTRDGIHKKRYSTMVYIGEDTKHTAMSVTVGLPLAMVARRILEGDYKETGVQLPIQPEIYNPVMKELEKYGIRFVDEEIRISQMNPGQTGQSHT